MRLLYFNLSMAEPPIIVPEASTAEGVFRMVVYGTKGIGYSLEASPDHIEWETIADFISNGQPTHLDDSLAANQRQRFYRVIER